MPGVVSHSRHSTNSLFSLHVITSGRRSLSFLPAPSARFPGRQWTDVFVFPASSSQKKTPSLSCLLAANSSSIKTFGKRDIFLAFPGLSVVHSFLLADVKKPILGSDIFRHNNLLIHSLAICRAVNT